MRYGVDKILTFWRPEALPAEGTLYKEPKKRKNMGEIIRLKFDDGGKMCRVYLFLLLTSLINFLVFYSWGGVPASVGARYFVGVVLALVEVWVQLANHFDRVVGGEGVLEVGVFFEDVCDLFTDANVE